MRNWVGFFLFIFSTGFGPKKSFLSKDLTNKGKFEVEFWSLVKSRVKPQIFYYYWAKLSATWATQFVRLILIWLLTPTGEVLRLSQTTTISSAGSYWSVWMIWGLTSSHVWDSWFSVGVSPLCWPGYITSKNLRTQKKPVVNFDNEKLIPRQILFQTFQKKNLRLESDLVIRSHK